MLHGKPANAYARSKEHFPGSANFLREIHQRPGSLANPVSTLVSPFSASVSMWRVHRPPLGHGSRVCRSLSQRLRVARDVLMAGARPPRISDRVPGSLTDIQTGPNGNLYVVSLSQGAIYQIRRVE